MEFSPSLVAAVLAALFLAGGVKGLIGVGLPTVSIALLINAVSISDALAIIVIPAIVTNVWQAATGGNALAILKRFWTLLVCLCVTTWFGVEVLAGADQRVMSGVFGLVLFICAAISLVRPAPPRRLWPPSKAARI
jgi:hypothetical protein